MKVTVAATQMKCSDDRMENIANAERLVRKAAGQGANIILIQELFESYYFCQKQDPAYYERARTLESDEAVLHFTQIAKELGVVIPVSFYEKCNNAYYNSIAVIDADGTLLGVYRKTHIPDGPGYSEKFYFTPGDSGFIIFKSQFGAIGIGICWDQWFPETARCLALQGAEMILYPTAIGSEPSVPGYDSKDHWQRTMQGHAAANLLPVIASNRIGSETIVDSTITFYGSSFITDGFGAKIAEASRDQEEVLVATLDLEEYRKNRSFWGIYRDRRPEMYAPIMTKDGIVR